MPNPAPSLGELPLATRFWFAWVCLLHVLFDGSFAARVWGLRAASAKLSPSEEGADRQLSGGSGVPISGEGATRRPDAPAAPETLQGLQLLALLQREGRLVDFLEQDVTTFSDEEVGAAARLVHEGCRKTLHRVTAVAPVRPEGEGTPIVVEAGFAASEITLVGNVQGPPPYRGTLRHRGWRATGLDLPQIVAGHDPRVLAPAEIEL